MASGYPPNATIRAKMDAKAVIALMAESSYDEIPQMLSLSARGEAINPDEAINPQLQGDRSVMWAALQASSVYSSKIFATASDDLRGNKEFVLAALDAFRGDGISSGMKCISQELKSDKDIAMAVTKACPFGHVGIQDLSESMRDNKEVALFAISVNSRSLEFLSERLRSDVEVFLPAVNDWAPLFKFVSEAVRGNKEIMTELLKDHAEFFEFCSPALQNDRQFTLPAVRDHGGALEYASLALKEDKEVCLAAVTQSRYAIKFVGESMKDNKEVALAAGSEAIKYVSGRMLTDKDFLKVVFSERGSGSFLERLPASMQDDKDVVLMAVQSAGVSLEFASPAMKDDKDVVKAAVKEGGKDVLQYASEAMKGKKRVLMTAVEADGLALEYASEALKGNRQVVLAAVNHSGSAFKFAAPALQQDEEFVLQAFAANPNSISYAAEKILVDRSFLLRALGLQGNDAMEKVISTLSSDTQVDVTDGKPLPGLYACDFKTTFGGFGSEILVNASGAFRLGFGGLGQELEQQLEGDDWKTCRVVIPGGFSREGDENVPIMFKMEKIEGPLIHWKARPGHWYTRTVQHLTSWMFAANQKCQNSKAEPTATMTWTYLGPRVNRSTEMSMSIG